MKRTFLLQDCGSEAVEHLLILNTDASTEEIQDYIYELKDKWYEFENGNAEDDEDFDYCDCEGEYILYKVNDKYDGETVEYDDILEY